MDANQPVPGCDSFGERFFGHTEDVHRRLEARAVPGGCWSFTDDTAMALSVADVLQAHEGTIEQFSLAQYFAARYRKDPARGYGPGTHRFMGEFFSGVPWHAAAKNEFGDTGSFGNGAAMRVAPVGAYHYDDFAKAAEQADRSAVVTHAHAEGPAGAIAVAVATAWFGQGASDVHALFDVVLDHTPAGATRTGIRNATALPLDRTPTQAAAMLGNGSEVSARDTVPFTLWAAARYMDSFEEALWCTVAGLGDRDTTCAIVGGMLGSRYGIDIPETWRLRCEPLSVLALR